MSSLLVFAVLLAIYGSTLCRTVYWYDSAEFATAAKVWGVPHPPGYPAYILVAHLLTYLPLSPAFTTNLLSALTMAGAMGLLVQLTQLLGVRPLYAVLVGLLLGTSDLLWANATVAEVYGPGLCFALGILILLIRALRGRRVGYLWLACWLAGFGLGVHYFIATLGLGYVWLLYHYARRFRPRYGDYVVATALFAFGLTVFVLLPLRAAQGAPLNFGDPQNWLNFKWVITGGTYGYFFRSVSWSRVWWLLTLASFTWTPPGLLFAGIGAATLGRSLLRPEWLAILLGMAGNLACFLPYLVHDPEVFVMPALVLLGPFTGMGAEWLHTRLSEFRRGSSSLAVLVPALLSAVVSYRTVSAFPERNLSHFDDADQYAATLVEQLPQGAFIAHFTTPPEWQYDAVFTYYRLVNGARPDVTMLTLPPPDLLAQLIATGLPVYVYTPTAEVVVPPFTLSQENDLIRLGLDGTEVLPTDPETWPAPTNDGSALTPLPGASSAEGSRAATPLEHRPFEQEPMEQGDERARRGAPEEDSGVGVAGEPPTPRGARAAALD